MKWRKGLGIAIAVTCTIAAVFLFDWRDIGTALRGVRVGFLVGSACGLLILASLVRGLRWLVMLNIPLTPASLAWSTLANGAAAGLGAVTPLQLGEALKIRFGPGDGWKPGMSAFMVERGFDLSGVIGLLLGGLAMHAGHPWATPPLLLAPLASGLLLLFSSSRLHLLPRHAHPLLEISRQRKRVITASLLTVPVWLLHLGLWWCVSTAVGLHLDFGETSILLGGVVLASVASMAPAGLGISELGSRGIMLWLGFSVPEAETTAIALRLFLGPLIVLFGLVCMVPLGWHRKASAAADPDSTR